MYFAANSPRSVKNTKLNEGGGLFEGRELIKNIWYLKNNFIKKFNKRLSKI